MATIDETRSKPKTTPEEILARVESDDVESAALRSLRRMFELGFLQLAR